MRERIELLLVINEELSDRFEWKSTFLSEFES